MTKRTCSVDGCDKPHLAKEYCTAHYHRWRKSGDPGTAEIRQSILPGDQCTVDGCDRARKARGLCTMHYIRFNRKGDVGGAATERLRERLCSIDGCGNKSDWNGMCTMHSLRVVRHGDPGPVETLRYNGPCTSGVCDRPAVVKRLCRAHYEQLNAGIQFKKLRPIYIADSTERDADGNKQCRTCLAWFPEVDFTVNVRARDGRGPFCPRCRKDMHLRMAHNITIEQYEEILESQGGVCAICRRVNPDGRSLHVDHDHACCPAKGKSCGKCVRALLCSPCNQGIGQFGDDPSRLRAAAEYLERLRG